MLRLGNYEFRYAESEEDFAAVHELNYRTFVREIPQHHDSGNGLLIDKFHQKNRYLIAEKQGRMVGMLSAHDTPPFSIADRLPDASILNQSGVRPVEIRLLAVEPDERNSPAMAGLVWTLYQDAKLHGYTHFVISGVVEQQALYLHLGFLPLGPAVGSGRAQFVPMWLPLPTLEAKMGRLIDLWGKRLNRMETEPADLVRGTNR